MNKLDKTYTDLLQDILDNGVTKNDRTGTGTISIFGRQIRHKMSDGFPLLTTKKMPFKTIITELLWFLRGDTNIKYLVDNGCHIWDGDAYKNYGQKIISEGYQNLVAIGWPSTQEEFIKKIKTDDEFAKKWGNLGSIYGKQWRRWNKVNFDNMIVDYSGDNTGYSLHEPIDQIANLINDLKTNPDSRRLMVSAWNCSDLDQMVLPPCHYGFQVYTRELSESEIVEYYYNHIEIQSKWKKDDKGRYFSYDEKENIWFEISGSDIHFIMKPKCPTRAISLMWNQRSVDTFLGLPFNIASYGLLLEIIAKAVNMVPDELIGNLGDVHLYSNHIEQAKEQIGRELNITERVNLANNNDINISLKLGDYNFVEEKLDRLHIQKHTREPYPLPTLKHMKTEAFYKSLSEDVSLVTHLDNTDFEMENYQSHPTIKAPLSN